LEETFAAKVFEKKVEEREKVVQILDHKTSQNLCKNSLFTNSHNFKQFSWRHLKILLIMN
jgi:hypothetical protein